MENYRSRAVAIKENKFPETALPDTSSHLNQWVNGILLGLCLIALAMRFPQLPDVIRAQLTYFSVGILPGALLQSFIWKKIFPQTKSLFGFFIYFLTSAIAISLFFIALICVSTFINGLSLEYWVFLYRTLFPLATLVFLSFSLSGTLKFFDQNKIPCHTRIFSTPLGKVLSFCAFIFALLAISLLINLIFPSPIQSDEDVYHLSVIVRLIELPVIRRDLVDILSTIRLTHPFPVTHFMMALVSELTEMSPFHAYSYSRGFWGVSGVLAILAIATKVTTSTRGFLFHLIFIAIGFIAGTFSDFGPGIFANFLISYAHPSNIAMSVYLPIFFFFAASFLLALTRREIVFWLIGFSLLCVVLAFAHLREVIQMCMYLSFFALVVFFGPKAAFSHLVNKKLQIVLRVFLLLFVSAGITWAYAKWYRSYSHVIAGIDIQAKADHWKRIQEFFQPGGFPLWLKPTGETRELFQGPFYTLILLLPILAYFAKENLAILWMTSCILGFLALFRFGLLTNLYVYATYFEITSSPVRNIFLFLYFIPGFLAERLWTFLSSGSIKRIHLLLVTAFALGAAVFPSVASHWSKDPHFRVPLMVIFFSAAILFIPKSVFLSTFSKLRSRIRSLSVSQKFKSIFEFLNQAGAFSTARNSHQAFLLLTLCGFLFFALWNKTSSPLFQINESTSHPIFKRANLDLTNVKYGECHDLGAWKSWRLDYWFSPIVACLPPQSFITFAKNFVRPHHILYSSSLNVISSNLYLGGKVPIWSMASLHNASDVSHQFKEYFSLIRPYSESDQWVDPLFSQTSLKEIFRRADILRLDFLVLNPRDSDFRRVIDKLAPNRVISDGSGWALFDLRPNQVDE